MSNKLERLCIKVPKVYDWILHQAEKEKTFKKGDIAFYTKPDQQGPQNEVENVCGHFYPEFVDVSCALIDKKTGKKLPVNSCGKVMPSQTGKKKVGHNQMCRDLCKEVGTRRNVFVEEAGTELQMVKLKKEGQYQIILSAESAGDNKRKKGPATLYSEPLDFFKLEKVLLCAPEGTDVFCDVYDFDCMGTFECNGDGTEWTLDIVLLICQSIQAEAEVKIEVEGRICRPREEIILPVDDKECPDITFPEQCSEVFPSRDKKHHHDRHR